MIELIKTPDILPNNMRQIRAMRNITIAELSTALSLNHSYISILETFKANMSGITALNIMKQLNANFSQLFDIQDKVTLPYTIDSHELLTIKISIHAKYLDQTNRMNMIEVEEILDKHLKNKNIKGDISKFKIIKHDKIGDQDIVNATVEVELLHQKEVKETFNINFFKETNYDLFEDLHLRGFSEERKVTLDAKSFTIQDGKVHILNTDSLDKVGFLFHKEVPVIDIKDVVFTNDKKGNVETINFDLLFTKENNIEYIQEYLNLSSKDVQVALGIGETTYNNLLKGNLRLSTKLMWKMCKLFKVPLEQIINVPLCIDKFN